jgi:hypothetical protein
MTDEKIERGAAEEGSGSPLTPTEVEASQKAPSESPAAGTGGQSGQGLGEHDKADSASNTDV